MTPLLFIAGQRMSSLPQQAAVISVSCCTILSFIPLFPQSPPVSLNRPRAFA